jgi:hypothetical protein
MHHPRGETVVIPNLHLSLRRGSAERWIPAMEESMSIASVAIGAFILLFVLMAVEVALAAADRR